MKLLSFTVGGYEIHPPSGAPQTSAGFLGSDLIRLGINLLLYLAVLLAFGFLIWGGIDWILSGGDKHGIEGAQAKIKYAIIGLVIALSAYLIINVIGQIFNVPLLQNPNMSPNEQSYFPVSFLS